MIVRALARIFIPFLPFRGVESSLCGSVCSFVAAYLVGNCVVTVGSVSVA